MNVSGMLADLNQEIARLTQIRDLLGEMAPVRLGRGRPIGSGKKADDARSSKPEPQRRTMSVEGREKIAAAQRKRWAAGKKASTAVSASTKAQLAKAPAAKKAAKKAVPAKKALAGRQSGAKTPPKGVNEATGAGE